MPVEQFAIIGIHGLSKKPSEGTLSKWWKDAICEGLNFNIPKYKEEKILPSALRFSMVYWNDLMGRDRILTLSQLSSSRDHYQQAHKGDIQAYEPRPIAKRWIKERIKMRDLVGDITEVVVKFTRGKVSRQVMKKKLKDLYKYYENAKLRSRLQNLLIGELKKHSQRRIMLISHSMGTIIAYDVLRQLVENKGEQLIVDHFITMGSPLGLPFITQRIRKERSTIVPNNIKKWTNFSDMHDPVCADPELANDYSKSSGGVKITDQLVLNDWPHDNLSHKSYGYLRTPEVSKAIAKFLDSYKVPDTVPAP